MKKAKKHEIQKSSLLALVQLTARACDRNLTSGASITERLN